MTFRRPRIKSRVHLQWVRSLPCILCGNNTATEAAHIRFSDSSVDKRPLGNSEKADDCWTLPLCGEHHRAQHKMNERRFWADMGVDPIRYALALWRVSGDHAAGSRIIAARLHLANLARGND